MMRKISVLGATGSIGQNTLDLIRRRQADFDVIALTGGANVAQLAADAIEFRADIAVIADEAQLPDLTSALAASGIEAAAGAGAIVEAASRPTDWTMSAIVGFAGLEPGLAAIEATETLALANKESLVTAGPLIMDTARRSGTTIVPVDSEHSAIFQALTGETLSAVERVIITASGGPFRDWPVSKLARASLEEALNHPNWVMGQRITIDSASLFNKALELIETKEFFGIEPEKIEVLVHPESLVHALVGFVDGAMMAHLGAPDMRHAIGFALNWPHRTDLPVDRLDLARVGALNFQSPDEARFPALRLAREVMQTGGLSGAAFIAAKDCALDAFLAGGIGFLDMATIVEDVLTKVTADHSLIDGSINLDNVKKTDHLSRVLSAEAIIERQKKA